MNITNTSNTNIKSNKTSDNKKSVSWIYLLKCFICGFAMTMPGMSGGSTAILLGIYGEMMEIAANILKNIKKYIIPLILTGISACSGILIFSLTIGKLAESHEKAFTIASAIIVIISLPFFIYNSSIKRIKLKNVFLMIGGFVSLTGIELLLRSCNIGNFSSSLITVFIAGLVLSVALILPGISFTYMLYFFGMYTDTMNAISNFEIGYIAALGIGVVGGILLFSNVLKKLMDRFPVYSDCFLAGFTLASAILLFFFD